MGPNSNTPTTKPADQLTVTEPATQSKSNKPLLATTVITSVLALAGIGAGIYFFMDSNNKSTEISNLNTKVTNLNTQINDKDSKITKLETEISALNTKNEETTNTEPDTIEKDRTAVIVLGETIAETETGTVFKIGQCSADGPSVKCPITTTKGDSLISYLTTDGILRLTLPND